MNLGVLLVHCQEGRSTSTFTRDWAERAIARVADYYGTQSGGRETITFKVFGWIELPLTEKEWVALGFGAYPALRSGIEASIGESLDPFTHILIGIDHPLASGGTTWDNLTHLAASNFAPSYIAHELGHRYGADDAYGEMPTGPEVYLNRFCVMAGANWLGSFDDPQLADSAALELNKSGPGMSAPTLIATRWLDENDPQLGVELSFNKLTTSGGVTLDVSALAGAPGPSWSRPPVVIRHEDLLIEYRVLTADGWDRGLPHPGYGAGGWVVVHRSVRSVPVALHVASAGAVPGTTLTVGKAHPYDLSRPGPLSISILSFDAEANTVRLHVTRRASRPALGTTTFGGVEVGGGGLIWTPGRGITPVPPRSPLIEVLEEIARFRALQEMMAVASREEVEAVKAQAADLLRNLERSIGELPIDAG